MAFFSSFLWVVYRILRNNSLQTHVNGAHTLQKHRAFPMGLNHTETQSGPFHVDGATGSDSLQNSTLPKGSRFFQVQYKFSSNIWIHFQWKTCGLMKLPDVTTCQNIEMLLLVNPYFRGAFDRGWITILILFF